MGRRPVVALSLLGGYVLVLAVVALWPEPVDKDVRPLIRLLHDLVPVITPRRVEIGANVVLFIPYGALLTVALRRAAHLVLPIVLVTTAAIEAVQALFPERTTSLTDVVANTVGGCIGLLLVAAVGAARQCARNTRSAKSVIGRTMATDTRLG